MSRNLIGRIGENLCRVKLFIANFMFGATLVFSGMLQSLCRLFLGFCCLLPTSTAVAGGVCLPPVCVCACFQHDISKIDAARITKLDVRIFQDESWKLIYFGVKGHRSRSRVTKHCWRESLHSCECWLVVVQSL